MNNKKIVIHLIQSLNTGGTENVLLKTLPRLSKEFEHRIVTLKEPGELAKKFSQKGIKVMNLAAKGFLDLAYKQKLFRFVNNQKPALIITHMFHADLAGRLLLRRGNRAPVIASLVTTYNHPRYWPARIFEKLSHRFVRHYFANSQAVKNFYVNNLGADPNKITVIYNGIDLAIFTRAKGNKIVNALQLPKKRIVITSVANFAKNKGHQYLLEAFEQVYLQNPQSYLLLVGEGEEKSILKRQISNYRSKNHIKFLGRRSDVPAILKATDIFILPTLFEGLSNAILEAMAAGCAVVTTDIPENRIMIKPHQTGLLVPTKNPESIAKAVITLINDKTLRQKLDKNAVAVIKNNFDLTKIAQKLDKAMKFFINE